MRPATGLLRPVERYAAAASTRTHGAVAGISLVTFVGTIVFGFVPVTRRIETSGYSTGDLQEATGRAEVDAILEAFQPVMESVVLLSALDYLFIVAGFFLFWSVHAVAIDLLQGRTSLVLVPKVGMVLTFVSRLLDALENLWVILIYANPESYPTALIGLMNGTQSAKWAFVTLEYAALGLVIVLALAVRFTPFLDGGGT